MGDPSKPGRKSIEHGYKETVDTIVHEELHHRWGERGIPYAEQDNDAFHDAMQEVIDRYLTRRGL